jgi:hypothetical protein
MQRNNRHQLRMILSCPPVDLPPSMSPNSETLLTAIPSSDVERLIVVLVQPADGKSRMELRQQSFSNGIGWFTQSTVQLEPNQVAALRNALGATAATKRATAALPREFSTISPPVWQPRLVHADSA